MTGADLKQIRLSLLRHLSRGRGLKKYAISTALLVQLLKNEGHAEVDELLVEAELGYLKDLKFVTTPENPISPENPTWRLTAEGRNYVAENALE